MRSWLVTPAMGVVCGGAAVALGLTPAVALAGAALAAVVRMLAGDSPAQLTAAVIAPTLAIALFAEAGEAPVRAAIALAAAAWTIAELARPLGPSPSPLPVVAVLPAIVAALLDPSFVALLAITGVRLITVPRPRPRWVVLVPVAGALAILLAVVAGTAWTGLAARWFGAEAHPIAVSAIAALAAAALGPLTAVAAIAGVATLGRVRYAELAIAAAAAGAILVDVRAGALGASTIGIAALLAGLAIGRLAALIRIPAGQALAAATAGLLIILPPAWIAIERRSSAVLSSVPSGALPDPRSGARPGVRSAAPPAVHSGHASR